MVLYTIVKVLHYKYNIHPCVKLLYGYETRGRLGTKRSFKGHKSMAWKIKEIHNMWIEW